MVTKVTEHTSKTKGKRTGKKAATQQKPWMKHFGKLKHLPKATERLNKRVEEAFENIDREIWQ
jgi:hypothetical protein